MKGIIPNLIGQRQILEMNGMLRIDELQDAGMNYSYVPFSAKGTQNSWLQNFYVSHCSYLARAIRNFGGQLLAGVQFFLRPLVICESSDGRKW